MSGAFRGYFRKFRKLVLPLFLASGSSGNGKNFKFFFPEVPEAGKTSNSCFRKFRKSEKLQISLPGTSGSLPNAQFLFPETPGASLC